MVETTLFVFSAFIIFKSIIIKKLENFIKSIVLQIAPLEAFRLLIVVLVLVFEQQSFV